MKTNFSLKQKLKFIKTEGNILSFVNPSENSGYKQIITTGRIEKSNGAYRIIGMHKDSTWTKSWESLVELIDWNDWSDRLELMKELR